MKVLYTTRTFYPEGIGGGEISALHIAKSIANKNNKVVICCLSEKINKPKIEIRDNLRIYRFPWKKLKFFKRISNLEYADLQLYLATKKIIKKEKPEILHFLNSSFSPLALFFKKIPKFATINGPIFCEFGGAHPNGKSCCNCTKSERFFGSFQKWGIIGILYWTYNRYAQYIQKMSILKCEKILPVSNSIKDMLIYGGIPKHKVAVIHNPINTNKKIKTNLKDILNIPKNEKIIIYVGRLAKDKGIHITLNAIKEIPKITFLIIGKKRDYYLNLKKITKKLKIDHKVRFLGHIDNDKLSKFYSISDIVVHSGYYYEPLSRMLLESASFGIPMIGKNIGGNGEIIKNNETGYLINDSKNLKHKILKLINNPKKYIKFSKNCLNKINKEFSYNVISSKLIKEYAKSLKK